jgi:NAD(P)H-nitrite reductase large subunit
LTAVPDPNPVICRCEDITLEEVRAAIKSGARDLDSIKRLTRAGMGLCQGYTCECLLQELVAEECGANEVKGSLLQARPPFTPLRISAIAEAAPDET